MSTKVILKIIAAVILGEIALILLTTVAQVVLVDGVYWATSSNQDLAVGGGATLLAGIISGFLASLIVGKDNYIPHIFISILIASETIYLFSTGRFNEPLWFDFVSSALLVITIWIGYYMYQKFISNPAQPI